MSMHDDGDEVRGLGFVALYTAYLEEQIDACVAALESIDPTKTQKVSSKPASVKVKYCIDVLSSLKSEEREVERLLGAFQASLELLEARNDVVHGRIYGQADGAAIRKSGRLNVPDRQVTSAELYDLANTIFGVQGFLMHGAWHIIPRALTQAKTRQED